MIFRYTILYVQDVAAALAFYKAAFGFEQGFLHPEGDYGELITGDTKLAFASRDLITSQGKSPLKADPANPSFGLTFEVEDVPAAYARAIAAGATPHTPPETQSWGQVTCDVSDPDGYLIELGSPIPMPSPG